MEYNSTSKKNKIKIKKIKIREKRKRNLAICNYVDGTRGYYAEWNNSIRERQLSYDFIRMWNLRNRKEDHRGREGKIKQDEIREGDQPSKTLLTQGNKLRGAGEEVGGWDNWVMGLKESMWCNEHWVLYAIDESLNSTFETKKNTM